MNNIHTATLFTEAVLGELIVTKELKCRVGGAPDHAAENRALVRLANVMSHSPQRILQALTDEALKLCRAGSAGISILEDEGHEEIFRWHALSGALSSHLGATTPRKFSPCGTVIDGNSVVLMSHPERHFHYLADVSPQIVEALLIPFTVNGRAIGTVWVVTHDEYRQFDPEDERLLRDLADFAGAAYALRLALEASEEGDRRKDEFLATVAHELRNPLSAARNASQYVQSRLQASDDPHLQSMLHVGERQLTSMSRMIDDLLDLARIRLDKVELKKERVSIETIMQQSVDSCFLLIEASQHQLMISLPNEPLWVEGDLLRLTQIVSNLLTNAAKYTPEGGRIEVNAGCAGENAVIRVRDNGIGISNSMLSSIFDLYAQGDAARERTQGGLGIGLTVVQRLVELHGGHVSVHSDGLGAGSEFIVCLPLASGGAATISPVADLRSPVAEGRVLRVLVVDDNRDSADSLALLLGSYGHEARAAYDGTSALQLAQSFRPEVVLQDVGMPGMDGYEVARKLRGLPETREAALIALTGFTREEDAQRARFAGFNHHLGKPVDFDALQAVLRSI